MQINLLSTARVNFDIVLIMHFAWESNRL